VKEIFTIVTWEGFAESASCPFCCHF